MVDRDAVADALALIEAIHRQDSEAMNILLGHADVRQVATFLAMVCDDLVGDLAEWWRAPAGDMLARLRASHMEA